MINTLAARGPLAWMTNREIAADFATRLGALSPARGLTPEATIYAQLGYSAGSDDVFVRGPPKSRMFALKLSKVP